MKSRDYQFIILILIIVIIGIFTYHYGGKDQEIVSYIGFAGTLTSIVLAIVTIIYSYYQNGTTIATAQRIEESSKEIIKSSERFGQVIQQIEDVRKEACATRQSVDALYGMLTMPASKRNELNSNKELIKQGLSQISMWGLVALQLCVCEKKKNSGKNLQQIINDFNHLFEKLMSFEYTYGFLIGYNASRIISINIDINGYIAVQFEDEFEESFNAYIHEAINGKYFENNTAFFKTCLDCMKKMYEL